MPAMRGLDLAHPIGRLDGLLGAADQPVVEAAALAVPDQLAVVRTARLSRALWTMHRGRAGGAQGGQDAEGQRQVVGQEAVEVGHLGSAVS